MFESEFWIVLLFAAAFVVGALGIIHTFVHWDDSDLEEM